MYLSGCARHLDKVGVWAWCERWACAPRLNTLAGGRRGRRHAEGRRRRRWAPRTMRGWRESMPARCDRCWCDRPRWPLPASPTVADPGRDWPRPRRPGTNHLRARCQRVPPSAGPVRSTRLVPCGMTVRGKRRGGPPATERGAWGRGRQYLCPAASVVEHALSDRSGLTPDLSVDQRMVSIPMVAKKASRAASATRRSGSRCSAPSSATASSAYRQKKSSRDAASGT
jgi:hypothetical protein